MIQIKGTGLVQHESTSDAERKGDLEKPEWLSQRENPYEKYPSYSSSYSSSSIICWSVVEPPSPSLPVLPSLSVYTFIPKDLQIPRLKTGEKPIRYWRDF